MNSRMCQNDPNYEIFRILFGILSTSYVFKAHTGSNTKKRIVTALNILMVENIDPKILVLGESLLLLFL